MTSRKNYRIETGVKLTPARALKWLETVKINRSIRDVITLQEEITRLPAGEEFTRGIINLRGDIIPVYDFRLKLKFEAREYDNETIILIVMIHEKKAGIIVDRVSEVIQLNRDQVTDAPLMQQIPTEYVIGIGQKDGKFVVLLKVSAIFNIDNAA